MRLLPILAVTVVAAAFGPAAECSRPVFHGIQAG
jgi:hypothetical protein